MPCSRGRFDLDQTWGPGLPRDRCPHTESLLKSLAQKACELIPHEGVQDPVKHVWPHCYTSLVLHDRNIDRSLPSVMMVMPSSPAAEITS
jgi:hypothetical protein